MNAKRREGIVGVLVLLKKRILMRHEKLGNQNTVAYTATLNHDIQPTTQGMVQALRAGEHLHCVMGSDDYSPD
ncbi:Phosphoglycerate mutase-like protein AT74 [Glycine soja]